MKKIIATTLIVIMVLMVFPTEALALNVDEKITVKKSNPDPIPVRRDLRYSGQWDVKVKNSNVTQGIGVKDLLDNKDAPNYIFIPTSKISRSLVTSLGGNWDFVSKHYSDLTTEVGPPNNPSEREETIYISFLAHLCGADPGRWKAYSGDNGGGYQEINTTPSPSASISAPSSVKAGESVRIDVRANTYVKFSHPQFTPVTGLYADRIKVSVEIDGKEVHYDNVRSRNYSKTITYTFDEPGKYTIRATAEDVVERSKTTTATINVTSSPSPPSKPGNIKMIFCNLKMKN